jgi:UPF0755 protein
MRRAALLFLVLTLGSVAAGAGTLWYLSRPTQLSEKRQVTVPTGSSARHIGKLLARKGIVRSARIFAWTVRLQGVAQDLEAGTYQLDGRADTPGIVSQLLKAPIQTRRVTIPEGLTRHEIAGLLANQGVVDSSRFMRLSEDSALASRLGIRAETLEGYLFPDTYFFDLETSEEEVIARLVEQFHNVFADSLYIRLDSIKLDLHQAVTLASIVEREAQAESERPVISGVFLRRLQLKRRLESCATVEYALGVHKKRLTYADLRVVSPFNTYRHRGLPPGPIGNPGRAALLATLYPTPTEYLYFVARGDGTHIFSHTNKEHERAKREVRRQERLAQSSRLN